MILADSNIWIDHIIRADSALSDLMAGGELLVHPLVIGEVALGKFLRRDRILREMAEFDHAVAATDAEVGILIDRLDLAGRGIGLVDVYLLASTLVTVDAQLWTRDRRLAVAAKEAGVLAALG